MKMKELLSSGEYALFGILGDLWIYAANSRSTIAKIRITNGENGPIIFECEASIGQLRALVKECARSVNDLLDIQQIEPHKKITVDNETPL